MSTKLEEELWKALREAEAKIRELMDSVPPDRVVRLLQEDGREGDVRPDEARDGTQSG